LYFRWSPKCIWPPKQPTKEFYRRCRFHFSAFTWEQYTPDCYMYPDKRSQFPGVLSERRCINSSISIIRPQNSMRLKTVRFQIYIKSKLTKHRKPGLISVRRLSDKIFDPKPLSVNTRWHVIDTLLYLLTRFFIKKIRIEMLIYLAERNNIQLK
jgi:hypothetical protein